MKILQINAVNETGSTGRIVAGLEQSGIASRVAYSIGASVTNSYVIGNAVDRKLHALGSRVFGRQAYFSRRSTSGLLRYIEDERPDVVHLHNLHANYVNLTMLLTYLADRDIATVVTLHDCWFFSGKCCHYTSDGCDRWEAGCGSCPRLGKDNPSWMIDATASMWADKKRLFEAIPRLAVVGVSDWIASEAKRSFLSCASDIRRIYNWVDLDVFRPTRSSDSGTRFGSDDDGFVILGVASSWSTAKGLDDFVRLAWMIENGALDNGPCGTPAQCLARPRVVLVGAVKNKSFLPGSISLVGATNDAHELAASYGAADVFLQLSREETFGKVTAEALACGTPAIVYSSTANAELVGANCGYVVGPGDLSQLMSRVQQVRSDTKAAYSSSCREFAQQKFDKRVLIADYVELYEQLRGLGRGD